MFACVVAVKLWAERVAESDCAIQRVSPWIFLAHGSSNKSCHVLLHEVFVLEEQCNTHLWLEQVPSQSNPADIPSREEVVVLESVSKSSVDIVSFAENWLDFLKPK